MEVPYNTGIYQQMKAEGTEFRTNANVGENVDVAQLRAEFDAIVQKKLDDPEWAYLRTDRPKLQAGWSAEFS